MICRNHIDTAEGIRRCARCGGPFCKDCLVEIQGRPYCAVCKSEQLLDYRSGVDRSVLTYANIWKRFGAIIVDSVVTAIPTYAVMFGAMILTMDANGQPNPFAQLAVLPMAFLSVIYEGLLLSMWNGQTLGKKALGIRVVRMDGSPISTGQAWGRAAMRLVLGCLWIVDYIPAFFTQEKTTLHDMVASTRVIET